MKFARWVRHTLLWDPGMPARTGLWGALWALRKLMLVLSITVVLTCGEWIEHRPPEIALIALIHLVFVLTALGVVLSLGRWLRKGAGT